MPLLVFLGLRVAVSINWGMPPVSSMALKDLGVPLAWMGPFLSMWVFSHNTPLALANLLLFAFCMYTLAHGAIAVAKRGAARSPPFLLLAWVLYAAMALSLSNVLWLGYGEFMRALTEFHILSALLVGQRLRPIPASWALFLAFAWLALAAFHIRFA